MSSDAITLESAIAAGGIAIEENVVTFGFTSVTVEQFSGIIYVKFGGYRLTTIKTLSQLRQLVDLLTPNKGGAA